MEIEHRVGRNRKADESWKFKWLWNKAFTFQENRPVFKIAVLGPVHSVPCLLGHTCWETVVLLWIWGRKPTLFLAASQTLTQVKNETCAIRGAGLRSRQRWWWILSLVFTVTMQGEGLLPLQHDPLVPGISSVLFFLRHPATKITVGIIHTEFPKERSSIEALSVSVFFTETKFSKRQKNVHALNYI